MKEIGEGALVDKDPPKIGEEKLMDHPDFGGEKMRWWDQRISLIFELLFNISNFVL